MPKRGRKRVEKKRKVSKSVYWAPRIISILFIAFLSMFALDVFDGTYGFPEVLLALFMHLIPSFILIIALVIAWRWEWVGAVVFILAGIFYIIMTLRSQLGLGIVLSWSLTIAGPAIFVGILFWMNWAAKRKG